MRLLNADAWTAEEVVLDLDEHEHFLSHMHHVQSNVEKASAAVDVRILQTLAILLSDMPHNTCTIRKEEVEFVAGMQIKFVLPKDASNLLCVKLVAKPDAQEDAAKGQVH